MIHLIHLAISATPPPSGAPLLLYVFGALLAGGGLTMLGNVVRHWRRGQMEDTELITRITKDTISGAKDILAEYRIEVEVVKRQVEDYRKQLVELMRQLAEANARIQVLEVSLKNQSKDLTVAQQQRDQLISDLAQAVEERHRLTGEIERLHIEITKLLGTEKAREDPDVRS